MVEFFSMVPMKTSAVVLAAHPFGETDKRIILLTRDFGKRVAIAKGASRPISKFGARLLPLSYIDILLAPGRNLDILTQCETQNLHPDIRKKAAHLEWGLRMAQFTDHAVPVGGHFPEIFDLFIHFLILLRSEKDPAAPAGIFLVKFMFLQGIAPRLDQCAHCKRALERAPRKITFGNREGGILCRRCAETRTNVTILPYPFIVDMERWQQEDWNKLSRTRPTMPMAQFVPFLEQYATQALQ